MTYLLTLEVPESQRRQDLKIRKGPKGTLQHPLHD